MGIDEKKIKTAITDICIDYSMHMDVKTSNNCLKRICSYLNNKNPKPQHREIERTFRYIVDHYTEFRTFNPAVFKTVFEKLNNKE